MISELPDGKTVTMYDRGYPLGFTGSADRPGSVEGTPYLYNHLRFVVKFHKEDSFVGARVVGFEVPAAGATVGQHHNMPPATQRGALAPVASP